MNELISAQMREDQSKYYEGLRRDLKREADEWSETELIEPVGVMGGVSPERGSWVLLLDRGCRHKAYTEDGRLFVHGASITLEEIWALEPGHYFFSTSADHPSSVSRFGIVRFYGPPE